MVNIILSSMSVVVHFLGVTAWLNGDTRSPNPLAAISRSMTAEDLPIAGVWNRQWEEDPLGDSEGADRDTLVIWTQSKTSRVYVDLRLPAGMSASAACPNPSALASKGNVGKSNRENLSSPQQLDLILQQKSFAGVLNYSKGDTTDGTALKKDEILAGLANLHGAGGSLELCTCFWRRDIDYQPPSGGLDIGVCASETPRDDGSVLLRETGDDASYAEGWLRLPLSEKGPFMALELVSENGIANARTGYWVRAGNRFAYAVGRPNSASAATSLGCPAGSEKVKDCVSKSLDEAVKSVSKDDILEAVFTYTCVAGEIDSEDSWQIRHSTNPELTGCRLVGDVAADALCCSKLSATSDSAIIEQTLRDGETRCWKILELDGCKLQFA